MKIKYWSDYMCPYCWIGETNLFKAIENTGLKDKIQLEMRSFQLDPTLRDVSNYDTVQRMQHKYNMTPEKAQLRIDIIDKAGREAGLDMKYGSVKAANTYDAHRLTKYAEHKAHDKVEKLSELIFKAVFSDNLIISDHEVLIDLAQKAGITDTEAIKAVLNSDMYGMEVKDDEREAQKMGVRSVPFFVFGNFALPGAYKVEELEQVLHHIFAQEHEDGEFSKGHGCTAEGCNINK